MMAGIDPAGCARDDRLHGRLHRADDLHGLVQPIWCLVDCVVDKRALRAGKVLWIVALIAALWAGELVLWRVCRGRPGTATTDAAGMGLCHPARARLHGDVYMHARLPPRHRPAVAAQPRHWW